MQIQTSNGIVKRAIQDLQRAGLQIEPLKPSLLRNVSCHDALSTAGLPAPQARRPTTLSVAAPPSASPHPSSPPSTHNPFVLRVMEEIRADQLRAAQMHTVAYHPG